MPRQEILDEGPLGDFAGALRRLRDQAGSPTYRELAKQAHYAASTLAEASGGRKLPSLAVTLAYVRACGGDVDEWQERWQRVAAELAAPESSDTCPYVGLAAFRPQDAEWFFGRERLTEDLVARVRDGRFVAVFGASGSGKSSLIRSGLLPRLADTPTIVCTPGPHPLEECAVRLAALTGASAPVLHEELRDDPTALHRAVVDELVLVVDQFEEVFTLCESPPERAAFIAALLTAARAEDSRIRLVLGVRADFYPHCAEHPDLVEALRDGQLLVGPMTADELRAAITQPAAHAGGTVEGSLLARVMADATGQSNVLPMVSHALRETWFRRRGTTLTLAGYEASGGIQHALARTAESVYSRLTSEQQRLVRGIFLRMVSPGDGTRDTKRRIARDELESGSEAVLELLATARLVTLDATGVEITHEALLHAWPRLHEWINSDRAGLRIRQQVTTAATAWRTEGRDPSALYRGSRLAAAREWAADDREGVTSTPLVQEFLTASAHQANRAARRLRVVIAGLVALVLVASSAGIIAFQQRDTAQAELNGRVGIQTALEAKQVAANNTSLAALLDLAGYRSQPTPQTITDLRDTENVPMSTPLPGHTGKLLSVAYRFDGKVMATAAKDHTVRLWNTADPGPLGAPIKLPDSVNFLAYSPDGKTIATADGDNAIRLIDVADPAHPHVLGPLTGHTKAPNSVSYDPTGRYLVSAADDGAIRLWDVADPAHAHALGDPVPGNDKQVDAAIYSPDGRTVVTVGHDGRFRLINVTDPLHPVPWTDPVLVDPVGQTRVYSAAFTHDSHLMAIGGDDFKVRLYDVTDPAHPALIGQPLVGHINTVFAVAFDPTGHILASGGADRSARLWDVSDPANPIQLGRPLTGHSAYIYALAFSPDGQSLATASADTTVRLWRLPQTTLIGHGASVSGVAYRPDGKVMATCGADNKIRLWSISDPLHPSLITTLAGHSKTVRRVEFSADGQLLSSASSDYTVRLWDVADPVHAHQLGEPLTEGTNNMELGEFSPDGKTLVTAGNDAVIRVYDLADPAKPRLMKSLTGQAKFVYWLDYSGDGALLASAAADDTVRLWDMRDPTSPALLGSLTANASGVFGVAFSPDNHTIAVAGSDSSVQLWDVSDPRRPRRLGLPLYGHSNFVYWVGFSPDGKTLASGSGDSTVRLWDVADPAHPSELGQLVSHTGQVNNGAFSPDGQWLATASNDHTVHLTPMNVDQAITRICATTAGNLDAPQWQRYLPDLPFTPPCR
ncbi:helix-turn-helix domain-containing protein [Kutzneria sp. NPDC052558]|uniref:nSTAND1 domain-containing NTPase n=1 Tax=Kutzneria sp. NPDC052558 TaxID=3364121 RepID=UPI0037CA0F44